VRKHKLTGVFLVVVFCAVSSAQASLIFVPNTYGLSAKSIGMGNAMTAVGDDYSMAYFNPGALGNLKSSQIDLNYLYAAPDFSGGPKDGEEVEFQEESQLTLIGFTMDLSRMFKKRHGLGLGFDIAVDDNMQGFLAFESRRSDEGRFMRYGKSSVTMVTSLGIEIFPKLFIGGGGFVLVKGENTLVTQSDMAGNSREEEIQVDAKPVIAPIIGIFAPIHKMITLGAVYRGKGVAEFSSIEASADALVSDSPLTTLNLLMAFKDTYVPQQVALGIGLRPTCNLLFSLDGTWANWADYEEEIKKGDVVLDESEIGTKDIIIPRLGIEFTGVKSLMVRAGYYYEDTPFEDPGVGNTVVLDNARHVGSFGLAYDFSPSFLNHPLTPGVSYFYQYMQPRTVESDDGVDFESEGSLHGVIGSLTARF
jgi:long-subunit fatty acid transport protein